jgi:hypothetical protein
LGIDESGEERLFGRCDDRDLSAASARSSGAAVTAGAARAASTPGAAGSAISAGNARLPVGAT